MFPADVITDATDLLQRARARGLMIATAESCTGGLIAGALTEIAGSSDVVDRGFVTYSNEAKTELLGVEPGMVAQFGAVSAEVARAMVEGALAASRADIAVAVTGVAGPGGGTATKPVGLVHLCAGIKMSGKFFPLERRYGDIGRAQVRLATVRDALALLRQAMMG